MTTDEKSLSQRNEAFLLLLDGLNAAQRRAVEQIEGPVLVVAGPGTGKTHILAARIGKILLETDARPQNILCLTFTDAGVSAMRERLLKMIGPDAYRVPISTFHGFCNRVIQENMEHFGKGRLEPITELERIELVRKILADLPPEHALRAGKKDAFLFENHLRDLFNTMKKEGWSPGLVLKTAKQFLDNLPTNPQFVYQRNTKTAKKGDLKTAQIREVTERMERLGAAADLYPDYLHAMERAGRYEYEDMILWVLQAFRKNEALLRNYQERFLYIQVDEFQDTNGAQYQLLQLLLNFWETPNAFIVGDDDQSIFEFQGARLDNLRDFHQRYQAGQATVVLTENYRSSQELLDTAARVIQKNEIRAVRQLDEPIEKDLHAHSALSSPPRLHVYETRLHELTDLVAQIETLLRDNCPPEEIACIYARHKQANRLMALLGKKGIPFQVRRPENTLDIPLVQQVRELLQYLNEESRQPYSGEHRLFRLLHADFFGLHPADLAQIAAAGQLGTHFGQEQETPSEVQRQRQPLYEDASAKYQRPEGYWRQTLSNLPLLQSLNLQKPAAFESVAKQLNSWIAAVHNLPLPQLLERLFHQTGLLAWVLEQPYKLELLQALYTFFDFVEAEVQRNPRLFAPGGAKAGLERLLLLLDSMDDNRLSLPLQQAVQAGSGIQLLTAHSAKGLEFRHVYLFDCVEEVWEKNTGGNRGRFALPPALLLSGEADALEARRRLFYVAMTRAKQDLQISYALVGENGKALSQSMFVEETGLAPKPIAIAPAALLETQALLLTEQDASLVALPEPAAFEMMLRNFSLSVTALNRYLRCPLAFYYEDFLKIPGSMSEAAAFGIAMHSALQQLVLKMKTDKKQQFPSAEALLKIFKTEMDRQRGYFSENNFEQRLALGRETLHRIRAEQVPFWRKRAIVERRIDRVELDGIPLNGVIDKIEWLEDKTIRIADYKTGLPDTRKTAAPDERQTLGGDYWRQMAFYQILLRQSNLYPERVSKSIICWLEPDKRGALPVAEISFSTEEIQFVESLIRDTWANIQAARFGPGCGQEYCVWCNMHRWNDMPETGMEHVEDGLDDG